MTAAVWHPAWYGLDQSIAVGVREEFDFFRPETVTGEAAALVFYAAGWRSERAVLATGTITRIAHPVLGPMRAVEAGDMDYTFVLADGRRVEVNAEESPGEINSDPIVGWTPGESPEDAWTLAVEIDDLVFR